MDGVWFLRIGSVSGDRVCGGVRGRVGGEVWFPYGNCVCGVCVRVVWVKDRVEGGDWLLHSRCTCMGVGVHKDVHVC